MNPKRRQWLDISRPYRMHAARMRDGKPSLSPNALACRNLGRACIRITFAMEDFRAGVERAAEAFRTFAERWRERVGPGASREATRPM